jgi:hypothetical protein
MVSVTISRGSTSIDIPLLESSGTPLFSTDFGKPFATVHENSGSVNPRVQDRWSAQINHTIIGRFIADNAHVKAIKLADLIKSDPNGSTLELSTPFADYPEPMRVAPQAANASCLQINYPQGYTDYVDIQLQLTQISTSINDASRSVSTPTASGTGPIKLVSGAQTITLDTDVSVSRSVGRPNDSMTKSPNNLGNSLGRYIYKNKVTADRFSLSFQITNDIQSKLSTITNNIFRSALGRSGILLDFNGVFGLGEFRVFPEGSAPIRYQRRAGHGDGQINLPTVDLRVIRDTN